MYLERFLAGGAGKRGLSEVPSCSVSEDGRLFLCGCRRIHEALSDFPCHPWTPVLASLPLRVHTPPSGELAACERVGRLGQGGFIRQTHRVRSLPRVMNGVDNFSYFMPAVGKAQWVCLLVAPTYLSFCWIDLNQRGRGPEEHCLPASCPARCVLFQRQSHWDHSALRLRARSQCKHSDPAGLYPPGWGGGSSLWRTECQAHTEKMIPGSR